MALIIITDYTKFDLTYQNASPHIYGTFKYA